MRTACGASLVHSAKFRNLHAAFGIGATIQHINQRCIRTYANPVVRRVDVVAVVVAEAVATALQAQPMARTPMAFMAFCCSSGTMCVRIAQ